MKHFACEAMHYFALPQQVLQSFSFEISAPSFTISETDLHECACMSVGSCINFERHCRCSRQFVRPSGYDFGIVVGSANMFCVGGLS